MFVTFEGPDGSGKSTALKGLIQFLKKEGIKHFLTREPGNENDIVTKKIRELILDPSNNISPLTEAILFSADRRQNLEKNIWPRIKNNELVISDRYFDSTFAYQGHARGLSIDKMISLQDIITEKTYPDVTFFFDVNPQVINSRLNKREESRDRIELEGLIFAEKVYEGYQILIKKFPERFVVINANKSKEKVFEELLINFKKKVLNAQKTK
ncbi:MAG: dTMP kinase [Mollicutes bacterium PWAP]|nr:dTMP kinase [Mollicutes bacterium PWAP]